MRRIDGGDLALNRYQHALTFSHLGRFQDALRLREALLEETDPMKVGSYVDRLDGDIALHHGHLISCRCHPQAGDLVRGAALRKMVIELRMMEARIRGLLDSTPLSQRGPSTWQPHTQCSQDCRQHGVHKTICCAGDLAPLDEAIGEAEQVARQAGRAPRTYNEVVAPMVRCRSPSGRCTC